MRRRFLRTRFGHAAPLGFAAAPLVAGAAGLAVMLRARGPSHAVFTARDGLALAAGLATYAAVLLAILRARGERLRITGLSAF